MTSRVASLSDPVLNNNITRYEKIIADGRHVRIGDDGNGTR